MKINLQKPELPRQIKTDYPALRKLDIKLAK